MKNITVAALASLLDVSEKAARGAYCCTAAVCRCGACGGRGANWPPRSASPQRKRLTLHELELKRRTS
jgi:hypothetical protein